MYSDYPRLGLLITLCIDTEIIVGIQKYYLPEHLLRKDEVFQYIDSLLSTVQKIREILFCPDEYGAILGLNSDFD